MTPRFGLKEPGMQGTSRQTETLCFTKHCMITNNGCPRPLPLFVLPITVILVIICVYRNHDLVELMKTLTRCLKLV
jgi:hypothetical protein